MPFGNKQHRFRAQGYIEKEKEKEKVKKDLDVAILILLIMTSAYISGKKSFDDEDKSIIDILRETRAKLSSEGCYNKNCYNESFIDDFLKEDFSMDKLPSINDKMYGKLIDMKDELTLDDLGLSDDNKRHINVRRGDINNSMTSIMIDYTNEKAIKLNFFGDNNSIIIKKETVSNDIKIELDLSFLKIYKGILDKLYCQISSSIKEISSSIKGVNPGLCAGLCALSEKYKNHIPTYATKISNFIAKQSKERMTNEAQDKAPDEAPGTLCTDSSASQNDQHTCKLY